MSNLQLLLWTHFLHPKVFASPVNNLRWFWHYKNVTSNDTERSTGEMDWLFQRVRRGGIAALYADDAVNHQVANAPVAGKEAIRRMFAREFATAKMVCIVENIFKDGEWAILEWKDPLGLRSCGFFHIKNNLIVYQRGYWDKLSFLKQHNLPIE